METEKNTDYEKTIDYLIQIPKFTHEPSTACASLILELLGHPERGKKVVHVAGTNGKGSVCAYVDSVLRHKGSRTGLFTSPHLVRMEERIRINGMDISRELFSEAFHAVRGIEPVIEEKIGRLSFFEYLFGMAMYCFHKENVEYIVLETGLGGRLDATNAIEKPCVTVITPVSQDHVAILGNTIEAIAAEKAGIIKKGVPIVFWAEDERVKAVVNSTAKRLNAPVFPIGKNNYEIFKNSDKSVDFCFHNLYYKDEKFQVPFPAPYQAGNAALAIQTLYCLKRNDSDITYDIIAEGISKTRWQGRFEEIAPGVIVDGAHNEDGVLSFLDTVAAIKPQGKQYILFMAMKDKDYHRMVELICERMNFEGVIVTQNEQERCLLAAELKAEFEKYTDKQIIEEADWQKALNRGREMLCPGDRLYCVGSLYLVGAVLEKYGR